MAEINASRDELYERAFASVNPCNILGQANARFQEPFQRAPNLVHFPPVRYPDLTAIPGLPTPVPAPGRSDNILKTLAKAPQDPIAMDVDSMGVIGDAPLVLAPNPAASFAKAFGAVSKPGGAPQGWDE